MVASASSFSGSIRCGVYIKFVPHMRHRTRAPVFVGDGTLGASPKDVPEGGPAHECIGAQGRCWTGLPLAKHVLADRSYDADWYREALIKRGSRHASHLGRGARLVLSRLRSGLSTHYAALPTLPSVKSRGITLRGERIASVTKWAGLAASWKAVIGASPRECTGAPMSGFAWNTRRPLRSLHCRDHAGPRTPFRSFLKAHTPSRCFLVRIPLLVQACSPRRTPEISLFPE